MLPRTLKNRQDYYFSVLSLQKKNLDRRLGTKKSTVATQNPSFGIATDVFAFAPAIKPFPYDTGTSNIAKARHVSGVCLVCSILGHSLTFARQLSKKRRNYAKSKKRRNYAKRSNYATKASNLLMTGTFLPRE
jgi:hypothetical protein